MSDWFVRMWLSAFGVFCIGAGFLPGVTIGPAFSRGKGHHPVTRGQRIVLVVFGWSFVLYGVMGWLN